MVREPLRDIASRYFGGDESGAEDDSGGDTAAPHEVEACPECGTSSFWQRRTVDPPYKCTNDHEFDEPVTRPHQQRVSDTDVLDDVIAGALYLGRWPRYSEYRAYGSHSPHIVYDRFGGWDDVVEQAKERFEETRDDWPVDDEEVFEPV